MGYDSKKKSYSLFQHPTARPAPNNNSVYAQQKAKSNKTMNMIKINSSHACKIYFCS